MYFSQKQFHWSQIVTMSGCCGSNHAWRLAGDEETVDKSIICLLIFSFLGCFSATEKQQQSCNSNFNFIEVIFYIEHAAAAFIQCHRPKR